MSKPVSIPIYTLLLFFTAAFLFPRLAVSQQLNGTITDKKGESIPYATVFIKELSQGTTSNVNGEYGINVPEGTYTVIYRSLGYAPQSITVKVNKKTVTQNIIMADQVHQLREIRVYGNGEDPAYPIMRHVIGLSNLHKNQVESYKANVYLRGTVHFKKVSRIIRNQLHKQKVEVKSGETFVDETYSTITFDAPDHYKQVIKSVNSTFPDIVDFPVMKFFAASLYDDNIDILISPLGHNAFNHYKYVYEGFSYEGDYTIDKIKVIPRRRSKQLFSGYIYIIDGLWCLHSADLNFDTPFGEVNVRQAFDEVKPGVWMPVGHNYAFEGGILGVKGSIHFGGSVKYRDVVLNPRLMAVNPINTMPQFLEKTEAETEAKTETEKEDSVEETKNEPLGHEVKDGKRVAEMAEILNKENITTRDMNKLSRLMSREAKVANGKQSLELKDKNQKVIVSGAADKDSSYWDEIRPIPLTENEKESFEKRDSLKTVGPKKNFFTSSKKRSDFFTRYFGSLFTGKKWINSDTNFHVSYPGIINLKAIGFNAVDGWKIHQEITFNKTGRPGHAFWFTPWGTWAINRKVVLWGGNTALTYAPMHRGIANLDFGRNTMDFNSRYTVDPFINAVASLFSKENYARYYENRYIDFRNRIDLANGLVFYTGFSWNNRRRLENSTNYSFFRTDVDYMSNLPHNHVVTNANLNSQINTVLKLKIEYTPRYYYRVKDGVKEMAHSDFPTFWFQYNKGIKGLFNSTADFDYLEAGLKQWIRINSATSLTYKIRGGWFPNHEQIHFADFSQTNSQPSPVLFKEFRHAFFTPGYYELRSDDRFVEAHVSYKAPYILLKYLPGISNTLWRELVWAGYYKMPHYPQYTEIGYSLIDILFNGDIGVFAGFDEWHYSRIGINLVIRIH
ncbi:DUF5686 and carboxypeptidase regulatory-like domain-containing protein [Prolixibacter sp. SD074]|uniref:DUF5686 and carboxypeptidase regulatory-like domain-containing protein n=1 Tax=Prolixibacter sp. SD074 TaxID=2652391 RepID=UPI00126AC475|nr:DUF5686 and carboxypeptidase regulatory-like domain-containing protein [Prolixibacter sp. SD074]GET29572.1 hypothetical protein SD074_17740 [Prolixibacter sp. SD074]